MSLFSMFLGRRKTNVEAPATRVASKLDPDETREANHDKSFPLENDQAKKVFDLRQEYNELIKSICYENFSGQTCIPRFPARYGDYSVGLSLSAYAQGRRPENAIENLTDFTEEELVKAIGRLQGILEYKGIHPAFTEFVAYIDQPIEISDLPADGGKTPEERYEIATRNWDSGVSDKQGQALEEFRALVAEGVDLAGPYKSMAGVYVATGGATNIDNIVDVYRRACDHVADEREDFRKRLYSALFSQGKIRWEESKNDQAFNAYIEGLDLFIDHNDEFNQSSPLSARIAFLACRMFAKEAMDRGDLEIGARFFDWCEKAGVDVNKDIDISDAARS